MILPGILVYFTPVAIYLSFVHSIASVSVFVIIRCNGHNVMFCPHRKPKICHFCPRALKLSVLMFAFFFLPSFVFHPFLSGSLFENELFCRCHCFLVFGSLSTQIPFFPKFGIFFSMPSSVCFHNTLKKYQVKSIPRRLLHFPAQELPRQDWDVHTYLPGSPYPLSTFSTIKLQ